MKTKIYKLSKNKEKKILESDAHPFYSAGSIYMNDQQKCIIIKVNTSLKNYEYTQEVFIEDFDSYVERNTVIY